MDDAQLKNSITERIRHVANTHGAIVSATIAGSFLHSPSLEGLSDIDLIVIVDELNETVFNSLCDSFEQSIAPVLDEAGYRLKINPTLGPLKFNEPKLAVLHLMLYSVDAHVEHVLQSPFTCLDWQQHGSSERASMAEIYPTFGLQPRHFVSSRRGLSEYLKDYQNNVVSYRELNCDVDGYHEVKRTKPMEVRDRYEFAYHVMRFLMRNVLKLATRRTEITIDNHHMMEQYFELFPESADRFRHLFRELIHRKKQLQFDPPIDGLDDHIVAFVSTFERQFRDEFVDGAVEHVAVRHGPTSMHAGETRFIGRINPSIDDLEVDWEPSHNELKDWMPARLITSPLNRCVETLTHLCARVWPEHDATITSDARVIEINYGRCDGLTVSEARAMFPELFAEWQQGIDARFPDGETNADVAVRIQAFQDDQWAAGKPTSIVCTHNAVLRAMVGQAIDVPMDQWHRIHIPYVHPIRFVRSKRFGVYVNLAPESQRVLFKNFQWQPETAKCK